MSRLGLPRALRDFAAGLRRNVAMAVALVVVTTVSLTLLGVGVLLRQQVDLTKGYWYDRVELSVFLCNEFTTGPTCQGAVTPQQRAAVQAALDSSPQVAQVFTETQQEAYQRFTERFAPDLAGSITPAQLQESFRVKLVDPERYAGVTAVVSGLPGVQEVSDSRATLQPVFDVLDRLRWATWGASLALLLAAALLTTTLIRVAAAARSRETSIMRLVGATRTSIQLPFVLEAVAATLVGAAVSWGLLAAFKTYVVDAQLASRLRFTAWVGWPQVVSAGWVVLGVGLVLSVVSASVALRRYVRV